MDNAEIGSKNLKQLFPGATTRLLKRYKTFHSEILIYEANYYEQDVLFTKKVVIKYFNKASSDEMKKQFYFQSLFSEKCPDNRITTPKPLYLDVGNRMTIMEYIEGLTLKQLLTKFRSLNKKDLNNALDLSAISLALYHQIFRVSDSTEILLNSPLLENYIIAEALKKRISLNKCNMNLKTIPFLDFTAANVIIDRQGTKISLIDFPQIESISTPHLDLARFRFGLKIIKQYPLLRLHLSDWWTVNSIFDLFLARYSKEMNLIPNAEDFAFIDFLEGEYARKLQNIYNTSTFHFRLIMEKYYMLSFIHNTLRTDKTPHS